MQIPETEFTALYNDLVEKPLPVNRYRTKAGDGRSQTFGIVNRRCLPPDASRQNWVRPYTYKLLLDFAAKWVDISWNAITVNVNYQALPHYDKGNCGISYLVAFGDYTGGELELHEGDRLGLHDIRHKPIKDNFSKVLHSVRDFQGTRMSLVFYTCNLRGIQLPSFSVKEENGKYCFYRGDEQITKKHGLPHPLRKTVDY